MNNLALKDLGINYLTQEAKQLQEWFFNDEIDEETYELQHQFNLEEIQQKAPYIIEILENTENFVESVKKKAKNLNELAKWLDKKSTQFNKAVADCLVANNMPTGFTKGIYTENGILYLSKSSPEIQPNIDEIDERYRKRKIECDLTSDEYNIIVNTLPKELVEKLKVKEVKLDKELYQTEIGKIPKGANYKVKVK